MLQHRKIVLFLLAQLVHWSLCSQIFFDYSVRKEFRQQLKSAKWFPETELDSLKEGDTVYFYSYKGKTARFGSFYVDTSSDVIIPIRRTEDFIRFIRKHKIQRFTWERAEKSNKDAPMAFDQFIWKDIGKWKVTSKGMGDLKLMLPTKTLTLAWLLRFNEIKFVVKRVKPRISHSSDGTK